MATNRAVDRPLRRDVRRLGRILGEVIATHEGADLLALEERIRALAIRRRRGPLAARGQAEEDLVALLSELSPSRAEPVIRAFSTYFALVNLAEQHHRLRRARAHAREARTGGGPPQRGSLEAVLRQARDAGVNADAAQHALLSLEVTLTFTAHPTQAARRTVLEKLERIGQLLEERDARSLTPDELARGEARVHEEVAILWETDELRRQKPTVADEVKNVLYYLEELWDLLPRVSDAVERAFARVYGEPLGSRVRPLRLHSWVGGDMDGNPFVTPAVLEDTIRALNVRALRRLHRRVVDLGQRLSQSDLHVDASPELRAALVRDEAVLPAADRVLAEHEPWRRGLRAVETRLLATIERAEVRRNAARAEEDPPEEGATHLVDAASLSADLSLLARSLREGGGTGAGRVEKVLDRLVSTGLSVAEMELRVAASDAREGQAWLDGTGGRTEGAARLLASLRRIARLQSEVGGAACKTLILSMTESAGDLLAALACARGSGLWDATSGSATLDVVPLFETRAALEGGAAILEEVLADPVYRRHLERRGSQEVMIGYSDSGKEVGLLAASAELRRAQIELPAVARAAGVPLRIFHGRGESVARGGGPSQQAILALPPGSVAGRYKATEQGEALDQKYGGPALSMRTLELTIGGALLHTLGVLTSPPPADEARYDAAFATMAAAGRRAYRSLVWEEPLFPAFFSTASPIDAIGKLPIGSRPAKRGAGGIEALRAIPWVFAWTQNRAILPGWFGVGSGLSALGDVDLLREMNERWPFFRAVISNVEMVLAKTDMKIAARYATLAPREAREAVWSRIVAEHARTRLWVKRTTGGRRLLEQNPSLARSIALRNPYVDPMSFLQVELLSRSRSAGGDGATERPLLLTLAGIAAGMRNTG